MCPGMRGGGGGHVVVFRFFSAKSVYVRCVFIVVFSTRIFFRQMSIIVLAFSTKIVFTSAVYLL